MTDICIVSTDPHLSCLLELEMTRMGFSCQLSSKPMSGVGLILLDADTGRDTGLPRTIPIVMITRQAGGEIPPALVKRAAHVLTFPFDLAEFRKTVVQTLVHHTTPTKPPKKPRRNGRIHLLFDAEAMSVSVNGGEYIKLSPTEYRILRLLNDNRGNPVDARQAADILKAGESNQFNVYICYLRRKLEKGNLRIIRTVRGRGYCIDA